MVLACVRAHAASVCQVGGELAHFAIALEPLIVAEQVCTPRQGCPAEFKSYLLPVCMSWRVPLCVIVPQVYVIVPQVYVLLQSLMGELLDDFSGAWEGSG